MLPAQDAFRTKMEAALLSKLYDMGILSAASKLSEVENKLTVAALCRRRLAVVMCAAHMAETVSAAVKFIEQGHVRVGPDTITDPAFLVTRHMEDFVTWVDTSKLKRTIMQYNDEVRNFSLSCKLSFPMVSVLSSSTTSIYYRDFLPPFQLFGPRQ